MSPRSSDLLWPFECRTCHDRALVHVTDISDPENFQIVHRCGTCGYLNVISQHRMVLPVSESLQGLTAPDQESIRAALAAFCAEPSGKALRDLLGSYVQHLDTLVRQQPQEAAAALLLAMREREQALIPLLEDGLGARDSAGDLYAKIVSRCTDLLYLLLCQNIAAAPSCLTPPTGTEAVHAFFRVFSPIASDAAGLALQSHGIDTGMWRCAAASGSVVVESTDIHDRVVDLLISELRRAAHELDKLDLVRLRWLEGRVDAGLGQTDSALRALEEARSGFASHGLHYDVAVSVLETAAIHLERGELATVQVLAGELAPIFEATGVHVHALAALQLFVEAVTRQTATAALARRLLDYLFRARHDEKLQFSLSV